MEQKIMNEQIKLLAKQAGINLTPAQFSGVLEDEVDEFTLQNFSEFIVKECATVADKYVGEGDIDIAVIIKRHFGIKE